MADLSTAGSAHAANLSANITQLVGFSAIGTLFLIEYIAMDDTVYFFFKNFTGLVEFFHQFGVFVKLLFDMAHKLGLYLTEAFIKFRLAFAWSIKSLFQLRFRKAPHQ